MTKELANPPRDPGGRRRRAAAAPIPAPPAAPVPAAAAPPPPSPAAPRADDLAGAAYVLHLGIHKTASTFLQRRFFPALRGATYLDLRGPGRPFLDAVLRTDDLEFDPVRARALLPAPDAAGGLRVLSDEQFYGLAWDGAAARVRLADRLAATLPGARLVVVLRRQQDQLASLYLQYVKTGGLATPAEFLASRRHPLQLSPAYFHYAEYVEHLFARFGRDRVQVMLYEDLRRDAVAFLNALSAGLDLPEDAWPREILAARDNRSLSPRLVPAMRAINRLASSERNPHQLLPPRVHALARALLVRASARLASAGGDLFPPTAAAAFLDGCAANNHRLAALLGRPDLGALGYPLP